MSDFDHVLERFVYEVLLRAGESVVERNSGEALKWDGKEFRSDAEVERIMESVRETAQSLSGNLVDRMRGAGIDTPEDIIKKKDELKSILESFIGELDSELKGGLDE